MATLVVLCLIAVFDFAIVMFWLIVGDCCGFGFGFGGY